MRLSISMLMLSSAASCVSAQQWTAWKADPTFPGIEVRERCTGFNQFSNRTMWDVQLRNSYPKNVDLSWDAEPGLLHGADAQADHAMTVRPGEVIDAHHTAPKDCSAGMAVRVSDVRDAGAPVPPGSTYAPAAPPPSSHPAVQGTWRSKDSSPNPKQVHVELNGNTVTGAFESPAFSFQITTPLPEKLLGSVSIEHDAK